MGEVREQRAVIYVLTGHLDGNSHVGPTADQNVTLDPLVPAPLNPVLFIEPPDEARGREPRAIDGELLFQRDHRQADRTTRSRSDSVNSASASHSFTLFGWTDRDRCP